MSISVHCTFLTQIICLFTISCMSSIYILDINTLSDSCFVDIFSHSIDWAFILLIFFLFPCWGNWCLYELGVVTDLLLLVIELHDWYTFWQGAQIKQNYHKSSLAMWGPPVGLEFGQIQWVLSLLGNHHKQEWSQSRYEHFTINSTSLSLSDTQWSSPIDSQWSLWGRTRVDILGKTSCNVRKTECPP